MSITTEILEKNGIDSATSKEFEIYYSLLTQWNEKMNLTAIVDEEEAIEKHFYDSIYSLKEFKYLKFS